MSKGKFLIALVAILVVFSGVMFAIVKSVDIPTMPETVQGEKGDKGETGPQGPKGEKGEKGDTGAAASIKIGTVTTGAAGSNASVTNSGTASNVVLDFGIFFFLSLALGNELLSHSVA